LSPKKDNRCEDEGRDHSEEQTRDLALFSPNERGAQKISERTKGELKDEDEECNGRGDDTHVDPIEKKPIAVKEIKIRRERKEEKACEDRPRRERSHQHQRLRRIKELSPRNKCRGKSSSEGDEEEGGERQGGSFSIPESP